MTSNNFNNWLKFAITVFCLILISIGFGFGYIYSNYYSDSCIAMPLSYGISEINNINDDNFTCSCTSISGKINPFYFDESGILSESAFVDSQGLYLINGNK